MKQKFARGVISRLRMVNDFLQRRVYLCRSLGAVPPGSIVLVPVGDGRLCCGLAGLLAVREPSSVESDSVVATLETSVAAVTAAGFAVCRADERSLSEHYLGGPAALSNLRTVAGQCKRTALFCAQLRDPSVRQRVEQCAAQLQVCAEQERRALAANMGVLAAREVEVLDGSIDLLRDCEWSLRMEVGRNLSRVCELAGCEATALEPQQVRLYQQLNAVLNSIDRLEVRGRDSAGISLLFTFDDDAAGQLDAAIAAYGLAEELQRRTAYEVLANRSVFRRSSNGAERPWRHSLCLVYKVAAEIGSLGDNVSFLRQQMCTDRLLQIAAALPAASCSISAHTRWASVGAISVPNCHPVDNRAVGQQPDALVHACLNGDIDNYQQLRAELEADGIAIPEAITTDTKIIPLQIEKHVRSGCAIEEAIRRAVNDFEGSHAITVQTDLAPGLLFLAQRGSGQAIFVGLADEHYLPTSEVYGFVEETSAYLKLDGESVVAGRTGQTQGQIFVLDQQSVGGLAGIRAMYYDGTPIELGPDAIRTTEITSRDIDRQDNPHYFLKEISESPVSVERTLQNRWKIRENDETHYEPVLEDSVVPSWLREELSSGRINRIFFVGQGTAGIAAQACANILAYYLNDRSMQVAALKSSELSGFQLGERDAHTMENSLTVAITQSGTTTDTNRTVDMVRERGGRTIAIVNRRDSDITFKVDGVLYTSSGRDIEMSVASTKAFYSQIVAGAILSLFITRLTDRRPQSFMSDEIRRLLALPGQMRRVLAQQEQFKASASRNATRRAYWATVGSGPNKSSADEIRIKLSELCYKTISTDYVEDKKHIDLSSEPLILVCAAGTREQVLGDVIKDVAIFQAHKALPLVIADEGEERFGAYAEDVFHVPAVSEHLAPVLNTLAGHLWGYYAALAIHAGSRFLHEFRTNLQQQVAESRERGLDLYEAVLDRPFRETVARFYREFRTRKTEQRLPTILGIEAASNLTLLLKYLAGRLPIADFEVDFGKKGTPVNMLEHLYACLSESINSMARPVDAIKHQAKTVTVGTSRIVPTMEGVLFAALEDYGVNLSQLTNSNIVVLKNLQGVVAEVTGGTLYAVAGLGVLGDPSDETTITVQRKTGVLAPIPSRAETDHRLYGTKRIIVREGNVWIGRGRKDNRSIIIIPVISSSAATAGQITQLLLVTIAFTSAVALSAKIKALGGKYERIANLVQETSAEWNESMLEQIPTEDLFGLSAEKLAERIMTDAGS